MGSIEIIDGEICLEKKDGGVFVRISPALGGEGPVFEMRDETFFDRIKKLLCIAKDYRVYKSDEVDERYFINDYPTLLWDLDDATLAMIAALPPASALRSDGRVITVALPAGVNDKVVGDAAKIVRAIGALATRGASLFEDLPGAQRQPRAAWDHCPIPQFIVREFRVTIDVSMFWGARPTTLSTPNTNALPQGILSLRDGRFVPYSDKEKPLLQALEEVGGQELAPMIGKTVSFYSNMSDTYLCLSFYGGLDEKRVRAGLDLLTRLATPKSSSPFR